VKRSPLRCRRNRIRPRRGTVLSDFRIVCGWRADGVVDDRIVPEIPVCKEIRSKKKIGLRPTARVS